MLNGLRRSSAINSYHRTLSIVARSGSEGQCGFSDGWPNHIARAKGKRCSIKRRVGTTESACNPLSFLTAAASRCCAVVSRARTSDNPRATETHLLPLETGHARGKRNCLVGGCRQGNFATGTTSIPGTDDLSNEILCLVMDTDIGFAYILELVNF